MASTVPEALSVFRDVEARLDLPAGERLALRLALHSSPPWMAVLCHQAGPIALGQRSAPSSRRTVLGELYAGCQQQTVRMPHGQNRASPPQASPGGLG